MALHQVLANFMRYANQSMTPSVALEAFSVLASRLEPAGVAAPKRMPSLKDQVALNSSFQQCYVERQLNLNLAASISQPHLPSTQPLCNLPPTLLFRTLKISSSVTSKSSKRQKVVHVTGVTTNQDANGTIASKLAANLSKARSQLQQAPVALASSAAGHLDLSTKGAQAASAVHEAGDLGGGASQPRFSGSEEERKGSRVVRIAAVVLLAYIGWNIYPLMGESMVSHAVALTRSKDPFLQRSGASRVGMIATTDKRRRKIVELGGVASLANVIRDEDADDATLEKVLDALVKVCEGQEAMAALREAELGPSLQRVMATRIEKGVLDNATVLLERSSVGLVVDG